MRDSLRIRALDLEVRIGVHTGEVEVRGDNYSGIVVHIGARVGALADGGEVLLTKTVADLVVGSGISFADLAASPSSKVCPASGRSWPWPWERERVC